MIFNETNATQQSRAAGFFEPLISLLVEGNNVDHMEAHASCAVAKEGAVNRVNDVYCKM